MDNLTIDFHLTGAGIGFKVIDNNCPGVDKSLNISNCWRHKLVKEITPRKIYEMADRIKCDFEDDKIERSVQQSEASVVGQRRQAVERRLNDIFYPQPKGRHEREHGL